MYNTTEQFKTDILGTARELALKVDMLMPDGSKIELGQEDIEGSSFSVSSSCMSKTFELGSAIASTCSISLDNRDGRWDDTTFDGVTLIPYCGLTKINGATEYIPMGRYIIDEPGRPYGILELKAADRLILLDETVPELAYPTTPYNVVSACCTKCNVPISPKVATMAHINDPWIKQPETELTCRDAISEVALMLGGFVRMSRDGYLEIAQFQKPDEAEPFEMPVGSRINFKQTSDEIKITGLTYDDTQIGTDEYLLEIEELELLNAQYKDDVLSYIWNIVNNFTYTAYTADYFGNPAFDVGDVILHRTRDNKNILSFISKHTYKHGGTCNIEAEGDSKAANLYKSANQRRLASVASKVTGSIEKQLTSYELASAQLSDMLGLMLGVYKSKETLEDGSIVYYFHDKPTLEESTEIWKFNGKALAFSDDGGLTWGGITVNSSLIIKTIQTVGLSADWIKSGEIDAGLIKVGEQTITEVLGQLSQDIGSLSEGGGNYIYNSTLGNGGVADGAYWGTGQTWGMAKKRYPMWSNITLTWQGVTNND